MAEQLELANRAYRSYGETTEFKNFQGDPMPDFDQLPETIQKAWGAASGTVAAIAEHDLAYALTSIVDDDDTPVDMIALGVEIATAMLRFFAARRHRTGQTNSEILHTFAGERDHAQEDIDAFDQELS